MFVTRGDDMRFNDVWNTLSDPSRTSGSAVLFDPDVTDDLPEPARRLLRRAIVPGTPLAGGIRLRLHGSMWRGDRRLGLTAEEVLVPLRGFAWKASSRMGPVSVVVRDHYLANDSAVDIRLFGLIPMGGEHDRDSAISSRGRLAAESIWVPSMLLPGPGVTWSAVDGEHVRVELTTDGETETLTLGVDPDGRLTQVTMQRWGDVGVDSHQRIPYGFNVAEERSKDGHRIGTALEGGWWYGTDRYDASHASRFVIEQALFM